VSDFGKDRLPARWPIVVVTGPAIPRDMPIGTVDVWLVDIEAVDVKVAALT